MNAFVGSQTVFLTRLQYVVIGITRYSRSSLTGIKPHEVSLTEPGRYNPKHSGKQPIPLVSSFEIPTDERLSVPQECVSQSPSPLLQPCSLLPLLQRLHLVVQTYSLIGLPTSFVIAECQNFLSLFRITLKKLCLADAHLIKRSNSRSKCDDGFQMLSMYSCIVGCLPTLMEIDNKTSQFK